MPLRSCRFLLRILILLPLLFTWAAPAHPARARLSSDPMAIISAVNALRAAHGLPPYVVDQGLMAYALEHSRYQASIHTATHQHSDGSNVWQHGMDENIATGTLGLLTPEFAVYTIWADAIHMKTMVGYATGSVGAGVADDGAEEYYTLEVRPGAKVVPTSGGGPANTNATPTKIIPIVPLLTVTPRADRWIIHTVGYGQSLWAVAIAYGVKMDQIRAWNSMPWDSTEIYAGQKLFIIAPASIWPTLTASPQDGLAPPSGEQTITPGRAIIEEPVAATEKAAYQTSVAKTQGPMPEGIALRETLPPPAQPESPAINSPAEQQAQAQTPVPTDKGPGPTSSATAVAEKGLQADHLPLAAGMLILLGGSLLVVLAFSLMRKQ